MAGGNAIASGSVILTASADGLKTGFAKAESDLKAFGARAQKATSGAGAEGIFGGFAAGGPIGAGIAAGMAAVNGLISGVESLVAKFGELSESMDKISKQSRALDVSTDFLTGLQYAADLSGISVEELDIGLARFRKNTSGPLDQALFDLADDFNHVSDAGERAQLLVDNFGKSGLKFAALFEEGSDGIQKLIEENKAMGMSFTAEQGKQVEAANDAITKVKRAFKGLYQQLVIGLAPVVEKVADFAKRVILFFKPGFDWLTRAWNRISTIGLAAWDAIERGAQMFAAEIQKLGLFDWVDELPTIEDVITQVFRNFGVAAAYAFDAARIGAANLAEALGFVLKDGLAPVIAAFKDLTKLATELPEELRPTWVKDMNKALEGADTNVANIGKKIGDWGAANKGGFGKTAEEFNKWLDDVLKPKEAGKEVAKGLAEGLQTMAPIKLSGAILAGSKEAYSMIVKNQLRGIPTQDQPIKNLVNEAKKGNAQHKKNGKELGRIRERLDELDEF